MMLLAVTPPGKRLKFARRISGDLKLSEQAALSISRAARALPLSVSAYPHGLAKAAPVAMAARLRSALTQKCPPSSADGQFWDETPNLKSDACRSHRTSCRDVGPREREQSNREKIDHHAGAV
jgi:hypothetical protein